MIKGVIRIDYNEGESNRLCIDARDIVSLLQEIVFEEKIKVDNRTMKYLIVLFKSLISTFEAQQDSSLVCINESSFQITTYQLKKLFKKIKIKKQPSSEVNDEEGDEDDYKELEEPLKAKCEEELEDVTEAPNEEKQSKKPQQKNR